MDLLKKLPAYRGDVLPIRNNQSFGDIKSEVCNAHQLYMPDYDKIAKDFWKGSVRATADNLFRFCKRYFTYVEESKENQTTRSPAAILSTANSWGVDCKHYAGFIAGVLDALKRLGYPLNWFYRFVSYSMTDSTPTHVFAVVTDLEGNEIFVDPVFEELDARFPFYWYKLDKNCSMLSRISGAPVQELKDEYLSLVKTPVYVPPGTPGEPITPGGKPSVNDPEFKDMPRVVDQGGSGGWLLLLGLGVVFLLMNKN